MIGMHKTEKENLDEGDRKYEGTDLDVFYSINVCEHAAVCVRGNGEVFDPKRKPWILPDNGDADQVMRVINACPSGALRYIEKEGKDTPQS